MFRAIDDNKMLRCTIENNFRNCKGRNGRDLEGDWVLINFSYPLGGPLFKVGCPIKEIQYTIAYCLCTLLYHYC